MRRRRPSAGRSKSTPACRPRAGGSAEAGTQTPPMASNGPEVTMAQANSLARAPTTALTDHELAARAGAGDAAAFAAIMRRHNRLLFRTARSILKSDIDA